VSAKLYVGNLALDTTEDNLAVGVPLRSEPVF